jgi:hypothetical protein
MPERAIGTTINDAAHDDPRCWKACWGQPLRSSNLLSSATSDQAGQTCTRYAGAASATSACCSRTGRPSQ